MKEKKDGQKMKRKIVSMIFYILNLGLFIFPWIKVGEESYNVLKFAMTQAESGVATFMEQAGVPLGQMGLISGAVGIEVFLQHKLFALMV
jgi:hypothetical protein